MKKVGILKTGERNRRKECNETSRSCSLIANERCIHDQLLARDSSRTLYNRLRHVIVSPESRTLSLVRLKLFDALISLYFFNNI